MSQARVLLVITLVCNAGTKTQGVLDTARVALNAHGDAYFSGHIDNIPRHVLTRFFSDPNCSSRWRRGTLDCDWDRTLYRRRRAISLASPKLDRNRHRRVTRAFLFPHRLSRITGGLRA